MRMQAKSLSAGYGGRPVIQAVHLALQPGEMVGLIGPNGCGKSTLLRALSGTLSPLSGEVRLDERPLSSLSSRFRAQSIAFVPQQEVATFDFTVLEVVLMGRYAYRKNGAISQEDYRHARRALAEADILHLSSRSVTKLSGGEYRRALLARALAQDAPLLLLDEPTAHLDITHQIELLTLVRARCLSSDTPIGALAALHDLNQAAEFCQRLILMKSGAIVAEGSPEEVMTTDNLRNLYDADTQIGRNPATGSPMLLALHPAKERGELPNAPRVHVICGGGSGAVILGSLVRAGYRVTTGVLNRLDTDQLTAEALGLRTSLEAPYSPFSAAACEEAEALMEQAETIIIAPAPFGHGNIANLELAVEAFNQRKQVIIIGDDDIAARDFTGGSAARMLRFLMESGAKRYERIDIWLQNQDKSQMSGVFGTD